MFQALNCRSYCACTNLNLTGYAEMRLHFHRNRLQNQSPSDKFHLFDSRLLLEIYLQPLPCVMATRLYAISRDSSQKSKFTWLEILMKFSGKYPEIVEGQRSKKVSPRAVRVINFNSVEAFARGREAVVRPTKPRNARKSGFLRWRGRGLPWTESFRRLSGRGAIHRVRQHVLADSR